jgi:hypothetical protein
LSYSDSSLSSPGSAGPDVGEHQELERDGLSKIAHYESYLYFKGTNWSRKGTSTPWVHRKDRQRETDLERPSNMARWGSKCRFRPHRVIDGLPSRANVFSSALPLRAGPSVGIAR